MTPLLQSLVEKLPGGDNFTPRQKLALLVAAVFTLLTIVFFIQLARTIEYGILYSNLSPEDAGVITTRLQEQAIPHQLSPDGTTISIPVDRVSQTRLNLAAEGLPQGGGVGFEIFDRQVIGATDFEQQMSYRRALQGELMRTINTLEEIRSSRVHIALPRESLFVRERKRPTASITLHLEPGKSLIPSQIDGITHLVASSIEGMVADDVIIIDHRGNILSTSYADNKIAKLTSSQLEYQKRVERQMTERIQSMLDAAVGPGASVVRVAADIDFSIVEKTEEVFDPESPVVRSQQRQMERRTDSPPGAKAGAPAGFASESEKTHDITNFEISRVTSRTVMPTGNVQKLSVAAIVDGSYSKNEKGEEQYQPRTREEIAALEQLVMKAMGFDQARGDQVVVTNIAMRKQLAELDFPLPPETWRERMLAWEPFIKYALVFVALLFIALFLVRPLIRAATSGPRERLTAVVTAAAGEAPFTSTETPLTSDAPTGPLDEIEMVKKMAETDAKRFAELLQNWLK